ncbi:hypothetical protein SUGI_0765730 [Cryptomeria japonica]|uniref:putative RING-H2 finger protein ATL53 n=1 Tax=Cryptomeria japonica TaxID=3369 RepID=UPI002414AAD8|nr:putative RING-H2 finger protein ATL53 [Cryptomeria japonica]GLJ37697.1 hypothetical protein SUGI_0765730 [Cryptomeria japonica]
MATPNCSCTLDCLLLSIMGLSPWMQQLILLCTLILMDVPLPLIIFALTLLLYCRWKMMEDEVALPNAANEAAASAETTVVAAEVVAAETTAAESTVAAPSTSASKQTWMRSVDVEMAIFYYSVSKHEVEDDCIICLSNYEEDEQLALLLPVCHHKFHVACIQRWLECHGKCPICGTTSIPPQSISQMGVQM